MNGSGLRIKKMVLVCALLVVAASPAAAEPGDHIRPSDTVTIIPTLDLGMEYRTNVYRDEDDATPGANARISPGIAIAAEGPDHEFSLGGEWDLRKFFYVGEVTDAEGAGLTQSERLQNLDRYNDFSIAAATELFKQSPVGLVLTDRIGLRNTTTDAEFAEQPFNTQFRNVLAGGVRISPTSALSITPGGSWAYDDYRIAVISSERYNARMTYGPTLVARWAFFPRTSLVLSGEYMFHRWAENRIVVDDVATGVALPDSEHARVMVGIEGQLTSRLFANIGVGYGVAVYDEDSVDIAAVVPSAALDGDLSADVGGLDSLLTVAQLRYVLSEESEVFAGYERSFVDSFFTNYVAFDYVYVGSALQLGDFRPAVKYGVRLEDYDGAVDRNDAFHRLNLDLGYDLDDWAALGAGTALQARRSQEEFVEYDDWSIYLLARFAY